MAPLLRPTGERIDPAYVKSLPERLLAARHEFMYHETARRLPAGSTVLDVGCGEGYGTAILARHGLAATGIDVEASVIESADRNYRGTGAAFAVMESNSIPFDDATFAAVTAFHVIEHVQDPWAFVHELARILKPRGCAMVTTPNREHRLSPGERPWNRFHIDEFDGVALRELMAAGFSRVQLLGVDVDEPARSMELERVNTLRRLAKLDPWSLRRFVPQGLIQRITWVLSIRPDVSSEVVPKFAVVDVSQHPIDLLVIASLGSEDLGRLWPGATLS